MGYSESISARTAITTAKNSRHDVQSRFMRRESTLCMAHACMWTSQFVDVICVAFYVYATMHNEGDVFVSYIFDGVVYYVACFVSTPLRAEVVSVVEGMLEGLQAFSGCFFYILAVCFLECVVFEFVRAVRCARCWGHLYVFLVRFVCGWVGWEE